MLRPIDNFFNDLAEPEKSCLQFLRQHILGFHPEISEAWSYGMPFYNYRGKRFCYLWVQKKTRLPYLGMVNGTRVHHPDLQAENRSRMKILLLEPRTNLPLKKINLILQLAMAATAE